MNKNNEQFNKGDLKYFAKARQVSMTTFEKNTIGKNLEALTGVPMVAHEHVAVPTPFFSRFEWYFESNTRVASFALALVLLITGGTSLAARGALPGDILYPVKIHVNEKAETLFSVGLRSSTETETAHAVARLSEVEDLAVLGRLDPELKAQAEARFQDSATKVSQDVKQLEINGDTKSATEVTSTLEDSLHNHRAILATLSKTSEDQSELLSDLASTVDTHLQVAMSARMDSEQKIATSSNPVDLQVSARKSLSNANEAIKKVETTINTVTTPELQTEAASQIVSAFTAIDEGNAKVEAGSYGDAFVTFEKARRIAEGTRLMLASENQIKSNIQTFIQVKNEGMSVSAVSIALTASTTATTTSMTGDDTATSTSNQTKGDDSGEIQTTQTATSTQATPKAGFRKFLQKIQINR